MSDKRARTVLIISTVANVVLMGLKLAAGILAHSRAMIADGVNSTLDIFFSVMILISFRLAAKPADKDHPYGHGNIEVLVAFLAALVIFGTGGYIIYDGIKNTFNPQIEVPGILALGAACFTIVTKILLYIYARSVSKKERSPAVKVQAADHLSDILATSAAFAGILLARLGIRFLDPVAAVVIGGFICWTGVKLVRENMHVLLDAHPEEKFFTKIKSCLAEFKEVTDVPLMRAHPVGTNYFLELTVAVEGNLSVREGHDIADRVRTKLLRCESSLRDVIVHVEPASD
jgi:cation diffusion facilitator family transporter